MKAYEITKQAADIQRGRVLMAIEGEASAVEIMSGLLSADGYTSTQCAEIGDKEGEIIEFFVISRSDKSDFMQVYKSLKKGKK
jgi:hypothetical protein